MTIQDIIDQLDTKPGVEKINQKPSSGKYIDRDIVRIQYNHDIGNNVMEHKWFDVLVKDIGTATEDIKYHKEVPDILKPDEADNSRNNLWTEEQFKTNFQADNPDITVINPRISQSGDVDIVTANFDDTKNPEIETRRFMVYIKDGDIDPTYKEIK